jgi:hypothetical protein
MSTFHDDRSPSRSVRRALAMTLLLAACACPASANETIASGIGARDCVAFNAALEKDSELAIDAYVAWSQGFISAFNWANVKQLTVRIDAAGVLSWLGQYCAANPRARVFRAVQEIIRLNAR